MKSELTAKNLQRLAAKAGLTRKALGALYCNDDGNACHQVVYQHWTGRRAIGWDAMDKYIKIFKIFGLKVKHSDFLE